MTAHNAPCLIHCVEGKDRYCLCDAEKGADVNTLDLKAGAENYLRIGGLSDEQILTVEEFIKEQP